MADIERLWPGETVAILATGPSLTAADVDYVRGKTRVVAINDAHVLAPWADALYSSDRMWWPRHRGVPSFAGMKFGIGSVVGKRNPFPAYPDIQVLCNAGYDGLELDPGGLRNGRNSGFAAINLAYHFGVTTILLLGYDMGIRGKVHFFGNHQGMLNPTEAHFHMFRRVFPTIAKPLRDAGVQVFNCTPNSSLDCFPFRTIQEVFDGDVAEVA